MQTKSNVKVTIIVPVHNSEKYLQQCLESALSQTLCDIEVLCIDSSSTDQCLQIISKMKEQDSRLVYIKDPNSSYGYKINIGIKMAKGDYVAILETDDQMSSDMLEKMYTVGNLYRADIVNSDFFEFFDYNGKKLGVKCEILPNSQALADHTMQMPKTEIIGTIWASLYRKEFILAENIHLNESPGASYQDASFLFLRGLLAKSAYNYNEPLYWYRMDNVGSSVKDDKKIFEIVNEYEFLKQELDKRGVKDIGAWDLFYYQKYGGFYWNYCRLSEVARELFLKRYSEELRDDIAAGALNREMCDDIFYRKTFLLIDDPDKFKEIVNEADKHRSVMTLGETLERLEGREIVVFGAGKLGAQVIDILRQNENRILRICDNDKNLHGTTLAGLEVGPVAETIELFPDACYLIVNRKHSEEMKAQLLAEGISEENIEIFK